MMERIGKSTWLMLLLLPSDLLFLLSIKPALEYFSGVLLGHGGNKSRYTP
jgi:hypothetical protein